MLWKISLLCACYVCCAPFVLMAQTDHANATYDTSYYRRYNHRLTIGPLLIKKNTTFSLNSSDNGFPVRYSLNKPTRLGLTIGYDFLTVSGSFGLGSLDPDYKKEKGKTKSLNLQASVYGKGVQADLHFQINRGLYFRNDDELGLPDDMYYVRPDLKTQIVGATVRKIFNGDKFSIKAPFVYDSWQKKSAGSFLLGGEFLYGAAKADSAFVPHGIGKNFANAAVSNMHYIMFGPTVGYAHTFVIKQHFFVTVLASVNADAVQTVEQDEEAIKKTKWSFSPNISGRGAIGYNSQNWELVLSGISNRFYIPGDYDGARYQNYTDQFRLVYARRINPGKVIPKVVGFGRKVIRAIGLESLIN